jgi:hypothetical protein
MEAVREGVEGAGWLISGLQKTTSHEFAGRWEGETSRSAYLFFHRSDEPDAVSIDVFLDETSRGMTGNLALVVDGAPPARVGDPRGALTEAAAAARTRLPGDYPAPLSIRVRLDDSNQHVDDGTVELRIKLRITQSVLRSGPSAVTALAATAVHGFERLLGDPALHRYRGNE